MSGKDIVESSFIEEYEEIFQENEFDIEEEELVSDVRYIEPDDEEDLFDDYWEEDYEFEEHS